jgi:hypothetical protein
MRSFCLLCSLDLSPWVSIVRPIWQFCWEKALYLFRFINFTDFITTTQIQSLTYNILTFSLTNSDFQIWPCVVLYQVLINRTVTSVSIFQKLIAKWIKKECLRTCCLQETQFTDRNKYWLGVKGEKKIYQASGPWIQGRSNYIYIR